MILLFQSFFYKHPATYNTVYNTFLDDKALDIIHMYRKVILRI